MFGLEELPEAEESQNVSIAYFMLSLMQIADQAIIDQMDIIVEAIAGKYGKDQLKFGEAAIEICDYEMAVGEFFDMVEVTFRGTFCELFDRDKDSELYNLTDEILDLVNKTKYLLQFEA